MPWCYHLEGQTSADTSLPVFLHMVISWLNSTSCFLYMELSWLGLDFLLSPNDELVPLMVKPLLLGRTSADAYLTERLKLWWSMGRRRALPSLLPFYKWQETERHRNICPGYVCLMLYESKVVANYCLCRVQCTQSRLDTCPGKAWDVLPTFLSRLRWRRSPFNIWSLLCLQRNRTMPYMPNVMALTLWRGLWPKGMRSLWMCARFHAHCPTPIWPTVPNILGLGMLREWSIPQPSVTGC